MHVLLTNDDGPFSPGLCALRAALERFGTVTVVCPAEERSGVAHAITWGAPVRVARAHLADGSAARIVTGTPADCVIFALAEVFDPAPDLLVSGVNLGINAGMDVFYSGTVAAALEGAFNGITSVALSTTQRNADRMDAVAAQAARVLRILLELERTGPEPYNVNIPFLEGPDPDVRFTSQSPPVPVLACRLVRDPVGRDHYWLDSRPDRQAPPADSDLAALAEGDISVTPLRLELTDRAALERLRRVASIDSSGT
ncbi:MAG: 5'/3'-nucleotidase SurE [Planctomycetota bacterium]|jgi:5'-nucleotidase